jgi:hypothetical protein
MLYDARRATEKARLGHFPFTANITRKKIAAKIGKKKRNFFISRFPNRDGGKNICNL